MEIHSKIFSFLGLRTHEEKRFTSLLNQGPFELRLYERMLCARISVPDNSEEAFSEGFKKLFDYIEGNNFKVKKIGQTGPTFYCPLVTSMDVGIILPSIFNLETIPRPIDRSIKVVEVPSTKVGVLRINGAVTEEILESRGEELKLWLKAQNLQLKSAFRIIKSQYQLPIPYLRSHELQLEVVYA